MFNKDNPHHAYLIEGKPATIMPEILKFLESLGMPTGQNPDLSIITLDSFKIDDARSLVATAALKSFNDRRAFVIAANNFLLEAQNAMLKLFEEPVPNTHFFVITESAQGLLPTFVSRFFLVRPQRTDEDLKEAEAFIASPLPMRIDFLKQLLTEDEDAENDRAADSARSKALYFLNALETALHESAVPVYANGTEYFDQIFAAREYLRQPGSSAKSLMEAVALAVPMAVPNR